MRLECIVPNKPTTISFCFVVLFYLVAPILSYSVGPTLFTVHKINKNDSESDDVCSTQACIHAASQMLERMDLSVKPCDDFYSFACGKFVNETVIPDIDGIISIFTIIRDKVNGQLHSLLCDPIDPNDLTPFNIAKKFYKTCMNGSFTAQDERTALQGILRTLGGSVFEGEKWTLNSEWNWTLTIKEFRNIGYRTDNILNFTIIDNLNDSSSRKIYIGPTRRFLNLNEYDDEQTDVYLRSMVDMAVSFGADFSRAMKEMNETLEFLKRLANISEVSRDYDIYNSFTLHELQKKYPYIEWVEYINSLLPSSVSVDENEVVYFGTPSFFENLGELLNSTKPRVIINHLMWCIIVDLRNFLRTNAGKTDDERREFCIEMVANRLPIAVSSMYVRKYFPKESKAVILNMFEAIRKELEIILNKVDWMGEGTRDAKNIIERLRIGFQIVSNNFDWSRDNALKKLRNMSAYIGYSDEDLDNSTIEKFYEDLKINEENYLLFDLSIKKFNTDLEYKELREPINEKDWRTRESSFIVDAFYNPNVNEIVFPAAILQDHFFSVDRPQYMNYGAIGNILGHEVTHAFDNEDIQFDEDSPKPEIKARYLEHIRCIIEQYENYTEPLTGLKLNGTASLDENIADGGIKAAYLAYQKWTQTQNESEKKLPGLNYTSQQMFWIAAAQNWCSVSKKKRLIDVISSETHSPERFRVIGPFSNRKEFASDFQCKEGSVMNPTKKCELWDSRRPVAEF